MLLLASPRPTRAPAPVPAPPAPRPGRPARTGSRRVVLAAAVLLALALAG